MATTSKLPSNRNFGFLFGGLLVALAAYRWFSGTDVRWIYGLMGGALVFFVIAVAAPWLLAPLNRAWMKLGDLMGRVVSPLVLGMIFFVLITPVSLISRLFGRDELRLKRRETHSYWIDREPPGPQGDSFKNQF